MRTGWDVELRHFLALSGAFADLPAPALTPRLAEDFASILVDATIRLHRWTGHSLRAVAIVACSSALRCEREPSGSAWWSTVQCPGSTHRELIEQCV